MRCTAGVHEGAASVTLDWWQGTWHFIPNEFMASALQATSSLPIQHLILKHHKLCNLPENLASMDTLLPHSLTTLDLSFNCFVALPPVVCQLVELRELFLTNNSICRLPDEMPNLKNLEVLHLQYNRFKALPVCVCGLTSLKRLSLENNVIENIPDEVGQLANLQSLYLKSNRIKTLPPSITLLSSLEELYLTDNVLRRLPHCWGGCSSLKQLHLAKNNLRFLPFSMINLHELQGLTLSGNKLKFPPLSACRGGLSSLKAFMLEKYRSSSHEWSSPDGTAELIISENLYYDSEDSDTPYEDLDKDPERTVEDDAA